METVGWRMGERQTEEWGMEGRIDEGMRTEGWVDGGTEAWRDRGTEGWETGDGGMRLRHGGIVDRGMEIQERKYRGMQEGAIDRGMGGWSDWGRTDGGTGMGG